MVYDTIGATLNACDRLLRMYGACKYDKVGNIRIKIKIWLFLANQSIQQ